MKQNVACHVSWPGAILNPFSGKAAEFFQVGNEKGLGWVGIFLAKKWEDKLLI